MSNQYQDMSTEDNTFNRLKRSDFDTVRKDVLKAGLMISEQLTSILEKHHWAKEDYKLEVNKLYGRILGIPWIDG